VDTARENKESIVKIAYVGACDRNNYGDVLLPCLFDKYIKLACEDQVCISSSFFALSRSDLRNIGGQITESIFDIANQDVVIVVGGEVMSARYVNMYLNLQTNKSYIKCFSILSKVFYHIADIVAKQKLNGKYAQPWIILPDSDSKVIYFAVGGVSSIVNNEKCKNDWMECIKKARFFSVRNKRDFDVIATLGLRRKCELVPDAAILVSKIWNSKKLDNLITQQIKEIIQGTAKYYVLQLNKNYGKGKEKQLANMILNIYDKKGYCCILLPIGRAQGHEDQVPLNSAYNLVKNKNSNAAHYIEENTIFETMKIISCSMAFIGTSLHGAITAASFEVPHVAVRNDAKVVPFLKTWNTTKITHFEHVREMEDYLIEEKFLNSLDIDKINEMKQKAMAYMEYVMDIVFERGINS